MNKRLTFTAPAVDDLALLRDWLHAPTKRLKQPRSNELSEHQEQCLVISWCHAHEPIDSRLGSIFAIPNGLWAKNAGSARKAKAEGLKKGVPDLFLAVAGSGSHGLFIEMKKTGKSQTTIEQKQWLANLAAAGYACEICRGHAAAIDIIKQYLDWGRD